MALGQATIFIHQLSKYGYFLSVVLIEAILLRGTAALGAWVGVGMAAQALKYGVLLCSQIGFLIVLCARFPEFRIILSRACADLQSVRAKQILAFATLCFLMVVTYGCVVRWGERLDYGNPYWAYLFAYGNLEGQSGQISHFLGYMIPVVTVSCVLMPFIEESIFVGCIIAGDQPKHDSFRSYLVSVGMFYLLHVLVDNRTLELSSALILISFRIIMNCVYRFSSSFTLVVLLHALFNMRQVLVNVLPHL